ncbi:MAG: hypothetical protein QOK37_1968 [Thermoanaerobaculia bacterium]|jgi:hypothetical protein|nr:hypothetical protein [Thermoanaerobaculia bacterium]
MQDTLVRGPAGHPVLRVVSLTLGLFAITAIAAAVGALQRLHGLLAINQVSLIHDVLPATLAMLIGGITGFTEIILRYRDEPFEATSHGPGLLYLGSSAVFSVCAYLILISYPKAIFPVFADDRYLGAIACGFGAMAILRSKLFVFKADDGKEYPIGPDIVVTGILRIIDRGIDRHRAARRQRLVFELSSKISDFAIAADFLQASLASFQNLSEPEKDFYFKRTSELKALPVAETPTAFKAMALGFMFLDIVGESNIRDVYDNLTAYTNSATSSAAGVAPTPPVPGAVEAGVSGVYPLSA